MVAVYFPGNPWSKEVSQQGNVVPHNNYIKMKSKIHLNCFLALCYQAGYLTNNYFHSLIKFAVMTLAALLGRTRCLVQIINAQLCLGDPTISSAHRQLQRAQNIRPQDPQRNNNPYIFKSIIIFSVPHKLIFSAFPQVGPGI